MTDTSLDEASPSEAVLFDGVIADLANRGWACHPAFVHVDLARRLRAEAETQWDNGEYRKAGIGRGDEYQVVREVRGDHIRWLEGDALGAAQRTYLAYMERFRLAVNRSLFLGLHEFEVHAARYPAGTRYERHLDRFEGSDERMLTCVLYLNEGWGESDGGQLRLETRDGPVELLPAAGLLATFITEGMWHEVLPATRPRLALTGWFRRRPLGTPI